LNVLLIFDKEFNDYNIFKFFSHRFDFFFFFLKVNFFIRMNELLFFDVYYG